MEMTKGTQSKIAAMMALESAVSASAPLEANELRQLEAGLKTKKGKPNLKSKSIYPPQKKHPFSSKK